MNRTASIVTCLALVIAAAALIRAQSTPSRPSSATPPQTEAEKKQSASPRPEQDPTRRPQPRESQEAATIKLETALVVIPVSVLDHDGKFIPNLTQRDFHIYEDNIAQEIDQFSAVEVPFNVVLLLDTSGSAQFKITDIQGAALAFLDQLRPQDRVMVVDFNSRIYVDADFTSDRAQLRRALSLPGTRGGTRLYDAVDVVLTERLKKIQGRTAIVLFTDGVDTESRLTNATNTLELVEESGALVYAIQYDTSRDAAKGAHVFGPPGNQIRIPNRSISSPEAYRRASQYLDDLTQHTGTHLYHAETMSSLSQAFSQIAGELRQQYALSYYPTNTARDGAYRRIRVQVDRPEVVVRARPGYRAAQDVPANDKNTARPAIKRDQP